MSYTKTVLGPPGGVTLYFGGDLWTSFLEARRWFVANRDFRWCIFASEELLLQLYETNVVKVWRATDHETAKETCELYRLWGMPIVSDILLPQPHVKARGFCLVIKEVLED